MLTFDTNTYFAQWQARRMLGKAFRTHTGLIIIVANIVPITRVNYAVIGTDGIVYKRTQLRLS